MAIPLLSDVQAQHKYEAGDRVVVRVSVEMTPDQRRILAKAVRKFVRADVRILCVNCAKQRLIREHAGVAEMLAGPVHAQMPARAGLANLSCGRVVFEDDDKLYFFDQRLQDQLQAQQIMRTLQEWAGPAVEVIVDWRHLA